MAEFVRSRLERKSEDQVTKRTVILGILTLVFFFSVLVFGLPFLIKFSIFLGEARNKKGDGVVESVLPPLAPRLMLPFEATNSSGIVINGIAEPGLVVELLKNDVSVEKTNSQTTGEFKFENVSLNTGENKFEAVAISDKGGSSELSKSLVVVFDNESPEIQMINPSEEKLTTDYSDFDVVGKSEKGVSVLVNNHVAMVDDEGKFKIKIQLASGKNEVEIVVKDLAGNEIKKKIEITYDI